MTCKKKKLKSLIVSKHSILCQVELTAHPTKLIQRTGQFAFCPKLSEFGCFCLLDYYPAYLHQSVVHLYARLGASLVFWA